MHCSAAIISAFASNFGTTAGASTHHERPHNEPKSQPEQPNTGGAPTIQNTSTAGRAVTDTQKNTHGAQSA